MVGLVFMILYIAYKVLTVTVTSDIQEAKANNQSIICNKGIDYLLSPKEYKVENGIVKFKVLGLTVKSSPEDCKIIK